jgi:hypothetical protein
MEDKRFEYFYNCINRGQNKNENTFFIMVKDPVWHPLRSCDKTIFFFTYQEAEKYMYDWQARKNFPEAYVKANVCN